MSRRLCMVVHGAYPADVRVARETRAAVAAGFEVDIVAGREVGQRRTETIDGCRVVRLPVTHSKKLSTLNVALEYSAFTAMATVAVLWRFAKRRYDIVQIHNPPDFLIAAALVPRHFGANVILDIHDISSDMLAARFDRKKWMRPIRRLVERLERWAWSTADEIVTVHQAYRQELTRRGAASSKITVVMNSLDESLLPDARTSSPDTPLRIVYHGTISPHYGVDLLVDAVALIKDTIPAMRLEIYGGGDQLGVIRDRVTALGLEEYVQLPTEFLPHRDVLRRISGAAIGVVPNQPIPLNAFALSTKLFEYVVLGIPTVVSDLPTLREHFAPSEVRFFTPGDAYSLASALLDVARDPGAARRRADAARKRYEGYRWELQSGRYQKLLERLA